MDENSRITETYKAEIAGIIKRVSGGLSEEVTTAIEPKIRSIALNVESQHQLIENIKSENKKNYKELIESVNDFESTTENLGKSVEQRNSVIVSSIERNSDVINRLRKTCEDDIISEIKDISSSVRGQKDLEPVIIAENKKISDVLGQRLENLEAVVKNTESATDKIESSFKQQNSDIISSIEKNIDVLFQLKKFYGDDLLSEIRKGSNSEELKSVKIEVKQLQTKIQTTEKLMYTTLVFLLVLSSLVVFLVFQ